MPRFFFVSFNVTTLVQAEDEADAWSVARSEWRDISREGDPLPSVEKEIRSLAELPKGWDGMCLPYGGDGSKRLKDLLPENEEPK